uniref:Uncharacterized protein n=1 Tax=mine drainage metagenome TaxID=410659 RepID=E6QS03_9ZZZZ
MKNMNRNRILRHSRHHFTIALTFHTEPFSTRLSALANPKAEISNPQDKRELCQFFNFQHLKFARLPPFSEQP